MCHLFLLDCQIPQLSSRSHILRLCFEVILRETYLRDPDQRISCQVRSTALLLHKSLFCSLFLVLASLYLILGRLLSFLLSISLFCQHSPVLVHAYQLLFSPVCTPSRERACSLANTRMHTRTRIHIHSRIHILSHSCPFTLSLLRYVYTYMYIYTYVNTHI